MPGRREWLLARGWRSSVRGKLVCDRRQEEGALCSAGHQPADRVDGVASASDLFGESQTETLEEAWYPSDSPGFPAPRAGSRGSLSLQKAHTLPSGSVQPDCWQGLVFAAFFENELGSDQLELLPTSSALHCQQHLRIPFQPGSSGKEQVVRTWPRLGQKNAVSASRCPNCADVWSTHNSLFTQKEHPRLTGVCVAKKGRNLRAEPKRAAVLFLRRVGYRTLRAPVDD